MKAESQFAIFEYEKTDANIIEELCKYFDQHAKNINDFFDVQFCGKKVKY